MLIDYTTEEGLLEFKGKVVTKIARLGTEFMKSAKAGKIDNCKLESIRNLQRVLNYIDSVFITKAERNSIVYKFLEEEGLTNLPVSPYTITVFNTARNEGDINYVDWDTQVLNKPTHNELQGVEPSGSTKHLTATQLSEVVSLPTFKAETLTALDSKANASDLGTASGKTVGASEGQLQENGAALSPNQVVVTNGSSEFITETKNTGHNLPVGTTPGTVASGTTYGDTLTAIRNGVSAAGDDLNKLYTLIQTLNTLVTGTTPDGDSVVDTIQEVLAVMSTFPEGTDILTLINSKIPLTAVVNNLTTVASGSVLDARQGKVLDDLITALTTTVAGKEPTIATGTSSQYIKGNKTLGTLADDIVSLGFIKQATDTDIPLATVSAGDRFWFNNILTKPATTVYFVREQKDNVWASLTRASNQTIGTTVGGEKVLVDAIGDETEGDGGVNLISAVDGKILPAIAGDVITIKVKLTAVTPAGTPYIRILLKTDEVTPVVLESTQPLDLRRGAGLDDLISISFTVAVDTAFHTTGGYIYVEASASTVIKNRRILVVRLSKYSNAEV